MRACVAALAALGLLAAMFSLGLGLLLAGAAVWLHWRDLRARAAAGAAARGEGGGARGATEGGRRSSFGPEHVGNDLTNGARGATEDGWRRAMEDSWRRAQEENR